ncbi:PucR family transcriptional regulator [Inconstantimicrobium mannanitabidum]|uniref:CdaR family transcriptional regulator n=1 Tax=Inconstantimicrobium mannanitabidum TaxID=1604901 RepID=A0ACB5RGD0_9CLOT|nr:helix-turn-helix domain-containing protein [Clostridium sp. TW13]GKX68134.1 CdaR family transcriptional regulator [Clostridium sp. TW13]
MLTLKKLLMRLNKDNLYIQTNNKKNTSYNMVNPIFKSIPLEDNTLYIGFVSDIKNIQLENPNIGLILIPDIPFKKDINIKCEFVIWDKFIPFDVLFNTIQMQFRKVIDLASNLPSILSALTKGNSLKALVKVGSEILGNPLIITNTSYKVLAMSDVDIDEPTWAFARIHGYCSQKSINQFRNEGITKMTLTSNKAILLKSGIAKNIHRIVTKIKIEDKIVGYMAVYEINNKFEQSNLDIVNVLADIISIEMSNNIYEEGLTHKAYENIIIDLLNNEVPTTSILQNRLATANWTLKEFLCLIKIPLSESDDTIWFFDYLYATLIRKTSMCKFAKYYNSLIIVVNYSCEDEYKNEILNITDVLEKNNLKCGVSRTFSVLDDLRIYYHQASKAYEIGKLVDKEDSNIYYYEDIVLFHFFSKSQKREDLQIFCHPGYYKLLEYDRLNGTEYCNTLYEYLLCGNSISTAAEKLFIHRNTMSYRINKISEITGLDLTNGKHIFKLYMAIKINEWLKL